MALHNIKIVVVDGGRSGTYKSKNAGVEKEDKKDYKNTPLYQLLNAKKTIKNKVQSGMTPSSVFAMDMGLQVARQVTKQTINYFINDIGRKNGDASLQDHINREVEIITDATGVLSSALTGAAAGAMFGIGGAVIGGVVGVASSAISLGFKQAERSRDFDFKEFKENNSIEYQRARASINLTTGRLR